MEVTCSSETSVDTEQTARRYIPEDRAFTLVFCSAYFSTLKMEVACSAETSVDTQQTVRRYIPEDLLSRWFLAQLIFRP
jgi:hypothetical protein